MFYQHRKNDATGDFRRLETHRTRNITCTRKKVNSRACRMITFLKFGNIFTISSLMFNWLHVYIDFMIKLASITKAVIAYKLTYYCQNIPTLLIIYIRSLIKLILLCRSTTTEISLTLSKSTNRNLSTNTMRSLTPSRSMISSDSSKASTRNKLLNCSCMSTSTGRKTRMLSRMTLPLFLTLPLPSQYSQPCNRQLDRGSDHYSDSEYVELSQKFTTLSDGKFFKHSAVTNPIRLCERD